MQHADEAIESLLKMGAECQAVVLRRATARYGSKSRARIESVADYVKTALKGEFDDLDQAYCGCVPTVSDRLETYLASNENEFIERVG
jgi:hypothetical protein